MARKPDARVEQAREMFQNGKKLIEISEALGVPEGTVRSWKNRYKWGGENATLQKSIRNVAKEEKHTAAEEKSLVESVMENEALTEKQRLFCLYYVKCFNATKAYQKAYGCSYESAAAVAYRMLENVGVKTEIHRLKQNRLNKALLEPEDIFQKYMDIAFADITDFVQFGQEEVQVMSMFGPVKDGDGNPIMKRVNMVKFNSSSDVDGTIITEVKQGKDGASIKLADRMKALDWLANHMDMATEEQRARIAKLKAETARQTGGEWEEDLSELDSEIYGD